MLWWLQSLYNLCTTRQPDEFSDLKLILMVAFNTLIMLAYYWIPAVMLIVGRRHADDIPYRWIWNLFILFIFACGVTHFVHSIHDLAFNSLYSWLDVGAFAATAMLSMGTAVAFTFMLPTILRLGSPKHQKAILEAQIKERTQELERALLAEKLLMREIHHRVKNNLQVISSLINFHKRNLDTDPKALFIDLSNRISAMGKLHDQLRLISVQETFDIHSFLVQLCDELQVIYKLENITIAIGDIPFEDRFQLVTPLALVLYEVISNSFKHAFPNGRSGTISITCRTENQFTIFEIKDDGIGTSPEVLENKKYGIGMTLIRVLAVQLEATVEWFIPEGGGTGVFITIDNSKIVTLA